MKQVWRKIPIEGCERYEVSDRGRVRSIINGEQRVLVPVPDRDGYVAVSLPIGKRRIHRLVALAFIPNPENLPEVNHIDGNKKNNAVSNLEWVDGAGNMAHAVKHGLNAKGERHGLSKLSEAKAAMIRSLYAEGFTQAEIAKKFKIGQPLVSRVLSGKRWA